MKNGKKSPRPKTAPAAKTKAQAQEQASASAAKANTDGNGEAETVEKAESADNGKNEEGQQPVSFIEEAAQCKIKFEPDLPVQLWEAAELIHIGAKKKVSGVLLMPEFVNRLAWIVSITGKVLDRRSAVMFNRSWDYLRRQIAAYVAAHCNVFLPDTGFRDPRGEELGSAYDYLATTLSGPFTDVDVHNTIFASDKGKVVLNLCQILAPFNAAETNCAEYVASLYAGNEDSMSDGNAYWRRHCAKEHVELLRLFKAAIDEHQSQASPAPTPPPTPTPAPTPAPTITPAAPPSNNAPTVNAPTINDPASTTPPTPRQVNKRGKAYPEGTDEIMAYVAAKVMLGENAVYDDEVNANLLEEMSNSKENCDRCADILSDLAKEVDTDKPWSWSKKKEIYKRLCWQEGKPEIVPSSKDAHERYSHGVKRFFRARRRP